MGSELKIYKINLTAIKIILFLIILTFFLPKIKEKIKQSFLFKNIFIIIPIFNIAAAVVLRVSAGLLFEKRTLLIKAANITLRAGYGFVLYIIFNAALLIFASVNYFINIKSIRR